MKNNSIFFNKTLVFLIIYYLTISVSYAEDRDKTISNPRTFKEFLENFVVREYKAKRLKKIKANAIFSGGGVSSLALSGAIYACDEEAIVFKRVGGTSAGAVLASLYAAGYTPREIAKIISDTDFKNFVQGEIKFPYFIIHIDSLAKNYSYFNSDVIYKWIKELLNKKGISTFKDLKVPLKIVATDIFHHRRVIFDKEKYPDLEVAEAIKMSVAIPLFFTPVEWNDPLLPAGNSKCLMLDGSILSTYPADLFGHFTERDVPTFGFILVDDERNDVGSISDVVDFMKQIINTVNIYHDTEAIKKAPYVYSITISSGKIRSIQFDISEEDKKALFDLGYNKMKEYLKNWKRYYLR
ncbi:MAG: patatin-like phospholipase family protein [Candidatus Omnitrophica bacterium]|nr:patatin-like phospholipase family protein [Candidatus Omnitrophota bacterium]